MSINKQTNKGQPAADKPGKSWGERWAAYAEFNRKLAAAAPEKPASVGVKLAEFYPVEITDLGGLIVSRYVATSEDECKDPTDRSAYREARRLGDVITMGKVIACPWHLVGK